MLEVLQVPYEDKSLLSNLIQFYRYDSSEFDQNELTNHGVYLYKYLDHQWTDEYRKPFYIKVDGELAGFVLVLKDIPKDYVKVSTAVQTNIISDFFIMRKFRNKGYGQQTANFIFNTFRGAWEVRQTPQNKPANLFWKKVINDFTEGDYEEFILDNERWKGPVQVFENKD
ncbi:putative acetyltransferase [Paenibacillus amylolyticus]|uniref:Acetyltransferase n=1 Tax=Paenibacillus amylolyticus TaxID=1451 RepID=A0AAP5H0N3_PAEAM|nr:GNAT family N-acetyltransferase [Paenibacillus amylolyticus]MDR6723617.1 putative acetyltransferase [Paenibacillus amylolyticus]